SRDGEDAAGVVPLDLGHGHGRVQQHRLLVCSEAADLHFGTCEVLVKAKDLLGRPGVTLAANSRDVCYVHLLFDRHEIVLANGVYSESYHPGAQSLNSFDGDCREEVLRLFPDCDPATGAGYGPSARRVLRSFESALLLAA
ncbi:MAG: Hint domain-containing protein, partial [Pseudomonadota bacterium]